MFEVYKRIVWNDILKGGNANHFDDMFKPDEILFRNIKNMITKLVLVQPSDRMKLKEVRRHLENLNLSEDFLLLKE